MACASIQIVSNTAGSDKNATVIMNVKLFKSATIDNWGKTLTIMVLMMKEIPNSEDRYQTKRAVNKTLDFLLESVCGSLYVGEEDLVDGYVEEDDDIEDDDDTYGEKGVNDEVFLLSNAKNAASMFDD
eukprot:CAMPEP_0194419854 /NCGR_PEP_ID=MMETSP0176-20130528/19047_1 /TAXON_ID=216777 /ORGANISM="Proboscia alata, Strain PI-D3" /LENGTH=127 /DNA_ID=CAMNT_0039227059 /DNA_START=378 /DNA_END=759 /DNA_ORIENTATION=-